ncbi:toll/interleukin-1 receptor domain-containing protein [Shimia sp. R10_1]|uniref:toll/interleukin-1 receptor domain-containing protein n=1 Tax=Shimia sp. R10_1 TaxID=2821095 RepID=UPI001ADC934E|nr:toll/interleukin-1 receptor domain-containing protein [Shimia sp. R10_1]MBO9475843.1 toll/interleukin-1 receptor domain-containing protein [Shimia sp. R10_1]
MRFFSNLKSILTFPQRLYDLLFAYDIFISYAHKDGLAYAAELDRALGQTFTTHLDTRDFLAGQNLSLLTRVRVRRSGLLIVVARPAALQSSSWVLQEVREFAATGREPIFVDVDGAVGAALDAPRSDRLSGWLKTRQNLSEQGQDPVLKIRDIARDIGQGHLPDAKVVRSIAGRFRGDRVETRRLRIITATMIGLVVLTGAAVLAAKSANDAALRARAEALVAEALLASAGPFQSDGNLVDALDRSVRALQLAPSSGVLSVASRVETRMPGGTVYAPQLFGDIRDLAISQGLVLALESNRVHGLNASDLRLVHSWGEETIGATIGQALLPGSDGFTAISMRRSAQVENGVVTPITVGGHSPAARPGGGFAVISSWTDAITLVSAAGEVSELPCQHSGMFVIWIGFLDRNRLALAGSVNGQGQLKVLDLDNCTIQITPLLVQPLQGVVLRELRKIALMGSQSLQVLDDPVGEALRPGPELSLLNPSALTGIKGDSPGFAVGSQDGTVTLFQISPTGRVLQSQSVEKLLPGMVTALVHDPESNFLTLGGRIGFFSGARHAALVSVPLESAQGTGLRMRPARPMTTQHRFDLPERPTVFASTPNGVVHASPTGPVQWRRKEGNLSFSETRIAAVKRGKDPGQIVAVAGFGDTLYVAVNYESNAVVRGYDLSGQQVLRHETPWRIDSIAGMGTTVLALRERPKGYFNFGSDPEVVALTPGKDPKAFPVKGLNSAQGRPHISIDPTGRSLVFARFDGAEFRKVASYDQPEGCVVQPEGPQAQVNTLAAVAFAPDGERVVLGTHDGMLSIWQRDKTCWVLAKRLETAPGRMIPTLAFDGTTVIGRTLSNPPLLRRWDALSGEEIGAGYQLDTRALAILPEPPLGWLERFLNEVEQRLERMFNLGNFRGLERTGAALPDLKILYVTPQETGQLDLSLSALRARLCMALDNSLESGLIAGASPDHPCLQNPRP